MIEKMNLYVMNEYEKKLKELMGEKEFEDFVTNVAKEAFREEIKGMADGAFKDFCLENFDKITE